MRLRRPAKQPFSFRQIVLASGLVAGDEHAIEPAMPDCGGLDGGKIGPRQISLVGHMHEAAVLQRTWIAPLSEVVRPRPWPGNPQPDQVHVEPAREILADVLAQPLGQAIDRRRIEWHLLLGRIPVTAPEMHTHRTGINPALHPGFLGQEQEQMEGLGVQLVIIEDGGDILIAPHPALAVAHRQPNEPINPSQRFAHRARIGHRTLHERNRAVTRNRNVEHAQRVMRRKIGRDHRADLPSPPDQ